MGKKLEDEKLLEKVDEAKRDFIRKVVIGTAFAVPVINSFSMEGLKIDLSGRMAKADEYDKSGSYDTDCTGGCGGSGGKGGTGGSGGTGGKGGLGGTPSS